MKTKTEPGVFTWNGKKDYEDKNLCDSVAHNLLVAFSNLNPDCQKIAAHAKFRGYYGHFFDGGDYSYDISGSFDKGGVPEKFSFEYGGRTYRISIEIK